MFVTRVYESRPKSGSRRERKSGEANSENTNHKDQDQESQKSCYTHEIQMLLLLFSGSGESSKANTSNGSWSTHWPKILSIKEISLHYADCPWSGVIHV